MKRNDANENLKNARAGTAFKNACRATCQKVLAQITRVKESIFAESRYTLQTQERLLRLALNEAEALAWQTMYPHLVFPELAVEKVQAVANWNARQNSRRRPEKIITLAA